MKKHEIITNQIKILKEDINSIRNTTFDKINIYGYSCKDAYYNGAFDAYCEAWKKLVLLIDSIERGDIFENNRL